MTPPGRSAEEALAADFDDHRGLLFSVAYRMLGSVEDAEDTVQDAWLRWSAEDRDDVRDRRAYLVRVTTRLALNRLRGARARRESYVGPWLPEPLLDTLPSTDPAADPEARGTSAESISMAMLLVLETLTPAERAVFVLREVFGYPHAEIAAALERSEASVRQLAHRARSHVQARRPEVGLGGAGGPGDRAGVDAEQLARITGKFVEACYEGDVEGLKAMLAEDVRLITDGGGKVRAARRPVLGARKAASFLVSVWAMYADDPGRTREAATINGAPGVVFRRDGLLDATLTLDIDGDGRVRQVFLVRNPDKLARWDGESREGGEAGDAGDGRRGRIQHG
ncbi:RNA polymerase sigma-70 factor [Allostreptomyces psammosilenae]|uniref:RNA polymerase sigma-70 factor (ECF subfamily) n=1 Tax=Allostreptomyces psammosilenae TaxID=1892865 RepID=A0A852ZUL1_9ACTN|nr:RNA polymerase sigma-70 factor [Allostreptomyces psammosilenae]NYI04970.1 RNA polymerase sigma-70 factor (ECF subfamily) [Allostreptomyces psammosilenae]